MSQGQVPVPPPTSAPPTQSLMGNPLPLPKRVPAYPQSPVSHLILLPVCAIPSQGPVWGLLPLPLILMDLFTANMTKYTTTLTNEYSPSSRVPTFVVLP